jgi:hypothetical protein
MLLHIAMLCSCMNLWLLFTSRHLPIPVTLRPSSLSMYSPTTQNTLVAYTHTHTHTHINIREYVLFNRLMRFQTIFCISLSLSLSLASYLISFYSFGLSSLGTFGFDIYFLEMFSLVPGCFLILMFHHFQTFFFPFFICCFPFPQS